MRQWALVAVLVLAGWSTAEVARADTRPPSSRASSPPTFAYYYIWFDGSSWDHAKPDLPLLGKYSSDDPVVMRRHVKSAEEAGIEGFIVSWKHTSELDRRLAQLVDIAESEHFKLAVMYEGLDFYRNPLPAERVAADLDFFTTTFANRAPFGVFAKPFVIWSGTWKFSREQMRGVTASRRARLLLLASERNGNDYERVADLFDGDAYYWSSVNPDTFPGYLEKLVDMGRSVHARHGLWIAPAAPGFDARLVGGAQAVPRWGGETLLREIDTASASSPDALGLISWNEFSESTQIEPSVHAGSLALATVGERLGAGGAHGLPGADPVAGARAGTGHRDSSGTSSAGKGGPPLGIFVLAGFGLFLVTLPVVVRRRRPWAEPPAPGPGPGPGPGPDSGSSDDQGLVVVDEHLPSGAGMPSGRPRSRALKVVVGALLVLLTAARRGERARRT